MAYLLRFMAVEGFTGDYGSEPGLVGSGVEVGVWASFGLWFLGLGLVVFRLS